VAQINNEISSIIIPIIFSSISKNRKKNKVLGTRESSAFLMAYTCKICDTRQARKISKQAYEKGVVIVQCQHCKNRHLISDQLNWFGDSPQTIEDILANKGEEIVKKTVLNAGDGEFC